MDDKVYTPVVIPDAPFPTQPQQPQASTSPSSGDVYTHQQIPDTPMPTKIIAHEVINNALNTKSKKILAEFEFTKSGAIQIGDFEDGQHGDIRISPDGITARNVKGETTFAIDGDTGDATFLGTIQAGSIITNVLHADSVITGAAISSSTMDASTITNTVITGTLEAGTVIAGEVNVGNGNVVIDGANKRIIINDGSNDRVLIGFQSGGF